MQPFDYKKFTQKACALVLLEHLPPRLVPVCQYQAVLDEVIAIKCPELFENTMLTNGEVRDKNGNLIADLYMTDKAEVCEDFIPKIEREGIDDEFIVNALFFDGVGILTFKDESGTIHYLQLTYPTLKKCNASTKRREKNNDYRYGGEEPEDFTIIYSDSAMCFAKCTFITASEYRKLLETLMGGKLERSQNTSSSPKTPEQLYKQVVAEQSKGYKYLLIYRSQKELLERLDNHLYTISNPDGTYLCDLLKQEFTGLTDKLIILDRNSCEDDCDYMSDWVLADDAYRQEVMSLRAAIVLTEEEWI